MKKRSFGKLDEKEIFIYTLENENGLRVDVSNLGGIIVHLYAPDCEGKVSDVVLGFDTPQEYMQAGGCFGAIVGPNANRISGAVYTLNGRVYHLPVNAGRHNIHSDSKTGLHRRVWEVKEEENAIVFYIELADGELGFSGNRKLSVRYELTSANGLCITYDGNSDKDTIINMTNHSYFNLDGQGAGTIERHWLKLEADYYTPVDEDKIPTGEIASVEGTAMDFRKLCQIGEHIEENFSQVKLANGYDHNWVCRNYDGNVRKVATVQNASGTRTMEVYSNLPGIQFYSGNFASCFEGKKGAVYGFRSGLALETQFYPDTPNKPQFPTSVFGPQRPYHAVTEYRFNTK